MMSHKKENQIIYYELFALNDGKMGAYSIDAFFFYFPRDVSVNTSRLNM